MFDSGKENATKRLAYKNLCLFTLDGYISVDHVEMDFKEILELGKKTPRNSAIIEADATTDGMYVSPPQHQVRQQVEEKPTLS